MLKVIISSFSYKKGLPKGSNEHGGGFVFDCRCLTNPGRDAANKQLSGRDAAVQNQLSGDSGAQTFRQHVFSLVDLAVKNYVARNFSSLQISFGCTGGQHRSVFFAEQLATHLRAFAEVSVQLDHRDLESALKEASK